MEKWSPEFRQAANLCMNNPHPAALFWGSELTMLYNEAYAREVAGNKHPSLMGTGFSGPFAELWDYAGPVFAECARTGISVRKENDYLPIDRHGLLEETFYSWSFTPLYGGTNRILGFYNAPFETTQQVVGQRRMKTINKLGERAAQAKTVKQFWQYVLDSLQDNHFDVPFALLYSVGESEDADHSSMSSGSTISLKSCHLEGSIGVPDGHIAAPTQLDLKRSREGFVPSFREAMRTREPTLLHTRDGTLPEALLEGINWRGFGDACREAIIFPIRPTNGDTVLAFLVLGVSPRRPYDEEYRSFTTMFNRQLATSLASVILFEDEVRRSRDAAEAAALEKEQLTQELDLQASRLRRMTELSPLGMFLISPEGVLREANDRFYEMTGHTRDSQYEMSWMDFIIDGSMKEMEQGWNRLVNEHAPWSGELQLKKRSASPVNMHGEAMEYWVLFIAHTEFSPDGSLRSIMGSITDISHLKWAQGLQNRRLQEAEETRRQQNEFIDITSHEMRNPLSAILQCADDISSTLAEYRRTQRLPSQTVVESCVEAANTIALCVQHQKSIVDDILTISKLDSNLLLITPVPAQPDAILRRAVKMFDPELQAKGITLAFDIRPSYEQLGIDWVMLDPSRVLQILINLMTNAIKFTAPAEKRLITVSVGASTLPPEGTNIPGFQYVPGNTGNLNVAALEDWGTGDVVYVRFKVQDTGCGLTQEEKQLLFQRFKQASPRTHAQYGGSGLGLFISKRLAELHGGQIGVASEEGQGSLFGFFVQSRRAAAPPTPATTVGVPAYHHLAGDPSLSTQVTPQRQDFASAGPAASLVATKAIDPRSIDILIVEDNEINQKVLANQLKKVGCAVHVANDGIEALAFLEKTHFFLAGASSVAGGPPVQPLSIILMDLEMPNMDGLTCVREIRRMEDEGRISRHVPVIAVTANVRDEQVAAAKLAGMDDVVSKPFRIPDLLKKIEVLLKES
jgi:PAS domain S-box-containing protein